MEKVSQNNFLFLCMLLLTPCEAITCAHRSFHEFCPEGWVELAETQECMAPISYTGPCDTVVNLKDFDEGKKREFAAKCKVNWACADTCARDYEVCPVGWVDMGKGVCDAPLMYSGSCLKHVRMTDDAYKRDFAIRCGISFPCKPSCLQQDFRQPCPKDWNLMNGICEAASPYSGPCVPFANLTDFTVQEKQIYASLCRVDFPCEIRIANANECEPVDAPCPTGWEHIGSTVGVCHNSKYDGPCRPIIQTSELMKIGKSKYMEMCAVEWPCKDMKVPNIEPSVLTSALRSGPVDDEGNIIGAQY